MATLVAKVVFFTSSALAALTLGGVAYLSANPRGFAPAPSLDIQSEVLPTRSLPPAPVTVAEPAVPPGAVELAPMVITGSKAPLITPTVAPARLTPVRHEATPPKPRDVVPCTDWRELGPAHIDDGTGTSVRRVRTLC